jgi:lysophospholipase L1-like esterase
MKDKPQPDYPIAATLLRGAGIIAIAVALLFSKPLVSRLDPSPPLDAITADGIWPAQRRLLYLGIAFVAVGEALARGFLPPLRRLFRRPLAANLLVSVLAVALPLAIAEIVLRPFTLDHMHDQTAGQRTNIYIRDAELGWRLRPGTTAPWGGVEVRINGKGLRGPEVPYDRNPLTPRLLYLGDSVTFGYKLPDYAEAYPFMVEQILEREIGADIETVNAAVGGYSPWQELAYLRTEGLKYQPDVVVIGFVLNDVTEKFRLTRFGGEDLGYQLSHSYLSFDEWLRRNSAVYVALQHLRARLRFGSDVQRGAIDRERANVVDLAKRPNKPSVQHAWSVTLQNLEELISLCRAHEIPVVMVVFPSIFQFDAPAELSAPQSRVSSFCMTNSVPCLDLLPPLAEHLLKERMQPEDLFLDRNHPSAEGNRIVGEMLAAFLRSEPSVWARIVEQDRIEQTD